jgi:hypothetical protein
MDYTIQLCVNQASGPPEVFRTSNYKGRPLNEVIGWAEASLTKLPISRTGEVCGLERAKLAAIFVRVVELDNRGSPTERVVFQKNFAQIFTEAVIEAVIARDRREQDQFPP